jgi:hypothetical protein
VIDLKATDMIQKSDKLLFNIWQELIAIREALAVPAQPQSVPKQNADKKPKVTCKRCGKQFNGHGEFLKHARECKKKEAKKQHGLPS